MDRDSYIANIYRLATGFALLAVYLVGAVASVYSAFPQNHAAHSHETKMHCSTTFCTCSHEDGECSCNEPGATTTDENPAYEKCPAPAADHYLGHFFSTFLTTSPSLLVIKTIKQPIPLPPNVQPIQHVTGPPLDPPRLA